MSKPTTRTFDCVQSMRKVRDKLSAEIADMNHDELVRWLRLHRYEDPVLQQLADKAAQHADAADRPSAGC
jgi:N-acetylglucosamine kinase-like BadF-type ATPase